MDYSKPQINPYPFFWNENYTPIDPEVLFPKPSAQPVYHPSNVLEFITNKQNITPIYTIPNFQVVPENLSWVESSIQRIGNLPVSHSSFTHQVKKLTGQSMRDYLASLGQDSKIVVPNCTQIVSVCLGHPQHKIFKGKRAREEAKAEASRVKQEYDDNPKYKPCDPKVDRIRHHYYAVNMYSYHVDDYPDCDCCQQELREAPVEMTYNEFLNKVEGDWRKEGLDPEQEWNNLQGQWDEQALKQYISALEDPESFYSDYYIESLPKYNESIEKDPSNPDLYLERSQSHFEIGDYESSIEDFKKYDQLKPKPITSSLDFCKGCYEGIKDGLKDSSTGWINLIVGLSTHPIRTTGQIMGAFDELFQLALSGEWGSLSEALLPEAHHLVTQWDNLGLGERARLGGHLVAKFGADIFVGGGASAIAAKGIKGASKLAHISKTLRTAKHTLVLESASTLGKEAAQVIQKNQQLVTACQEAGLSARQMFKLKETGELNKPLHQVYEGLFPSKAMRESFELFQRAEPALKPYRNKIMPETQLREIIQSTGIKPPIRPDVPANFLVKVSKRGGGIIYIDPLNTQNTVRAMPGKPHSKYPFQRNPYVIQRKGNKALDRMGNLVEYESPAAHIPSNEFVYRD